MSGPWTAWTATMQASGGVCGSPLLFPHRRSGWPCRQDTDHADRTRRQPWPAAAAVPDPCPPRATPAAMSAMAAGITHVHAGGRRAGGGRTSVRGPQIADTGLAIDTTLAACAVHQPSAQWSFRKQRTVFRLVTTFSALPSRPALRAAACGGRPRPAARRRWCALLAAGNEVGAAPDTFQFLASAASWRLLDWDDKLR
jgi:hypothetical protein